MKAVKKSLGLLVLAVLFCLGGCGGKEEKQQIELLEADQSLFTYENTEACDRITVDENGLLYTVAYVPEEYTELRPAKQKICVYDLDGSCIAEKELYFGNGTVNVMRAEGELLYAVAPKAVGVNTVHVIYSINTATWEFSELAEVSGFSLVRDFVHIGDYFYLLGILTHAEAKNYALHPDVLSYEYIGEAVARVSANAKAEESVAEQIQIEFPISIFGTKQNTLAIYAYTEENGFGYYEFDPEALTLSETGWKNTNVCDNNHMECEDGVLFTREYRLYYGTIDGMEAEVYSEDALIFNAPAYRKGFAFFKNVANGGAVERVCIAGTMQDNKVIHLLMHTDVQDKPYGCGYRMEKEALLSEEFALKVLAQDSDFDLYALSSRDNSSYNLMKNGAFYPLNEVEGVQEYLDACFPYVKELATNEDGDVWMLPVALAIPGLLYNKEYCAEQEVDFASMDFAEFLSFSEETRELQPELTSLSTYVIIEELFGQYLNMQDSFDTQLFREYAAQINEITGGKSWSFTFNKTNELREGGAPEFYYSYEVYQYGFKEYAKALGSSEAYGVLGVPKMAEGIGNVGTITFLAVNPQSDNLEATLDYISAFADYMLQKQDSFMLSNKATYTQTPFMMECYQLYADGDIRFDADSEVYETLFYSYLSGKIELEDMVTEIERRRKIYMEE